MAKFIAKVLNKELDYKYSVDSRPGNDIRYGLRGCKLFDLGWKQPKNFEDSLEKCILWTLRNPQWLEK